MGELSVAAAQLKDDREAKPSLGFTEAERQPVKEKPAVGKLAFSRAGYELAQSWLNAHILMGLHRHLTTTPFNSLNIDGIFEVFSSRQMCNW